MTVESGGPYAIFHIILSCLIIFAQYILNKLNLKQYWHNYLYSGLRNEMYFQTTFWMLGNLILTIEVRPKQWKNDNMS